MKGLAVVIGAMLCGLFWAGIVAPLIARAVGVNMRFTIWKPFRGVRQVTMTQWVWISGVLRCGVGLFVFHTLFDVLDWIVLGSQSSHSRLDFWLVALRLVISLLAGGLLGIWTWPKQNFAS